jgi:hypothetical protein
MVAQSKIKKVSKNSTLSDLQNMKKHNPFNLDANATALIKQAKDMLREQGVRAPSSSDAVRFLAAQAGIEVNLKYVEE